MNALKSWPRTRWLRLLVHLGALLPLAWLAWQYASGSLIDPVGQITALTGQGALILLVLSLAGTPLALLTGFRSLLAVRRTLGLYAFVYAGLHFLTFVGLDYGFDLELLPAAIIEQPFVIVGTAAGSILLILALTSTRGWQQRLSQNWKRLHRLAYLAGILAVIHFSWLSKDPAAPRRYAILLALLLLLRLPPIRRTLSHLRPRRSQA